MAEERGRGGWDRPSQGEVLGGAEGGGGDKEGVKTCGGCRRWGVGEEEVGEGEYWWRVLG